MRRPRRNDRGYQPNTALVSRNASRPNRPHSRPSPDLPGEHEELNESLNHDSLARDLFAHVDAIGPERQATALRRMLFLLELNQRAWGSIAQFYGPQRELRLHGPFGRPLPPA